MKLELSDAKLLGELMGVLAGHGCRADQIAPNVCRIVYPRAWTARDARLELTFFVRALAGQSPGCPGGSQRLATRFVSRTPDQGIPQVRTPEHDTP